MYNGILENIVGGTPHDQAFICGALSPFDRSDLSNENIKALSRTPIRVYHDADLMWAMESNKSAYNMTMTATSEMILQLQLMGNTRAEFIKKKRLINRSRIKTQPTE